MRFYEVDSSVDAIMSAAMLAQTRASSSGKQGKLSMNGFLQMLANSGIMMDYDGFKTVYDTNPQIANVIAQFNKDSITFVGDSDDEDAEFEPTQGEMPDDERVAKMAKSAMKTREFVEATVTEDREVMVRATNIDYDGPALDKLPTDVKVKVMVNPGDSEDDIFDMVADELEDRYGVKVSGFDMNMMESVLLSKDMREKIAKIIMNRPTKGVVPALQKYGKKFGDFIQKKMDEGELPPHLSKMFGKDGSQVDTRTDVMKQMRDIVDNKQAMNVTFGDGKQMVDMYTASVLVQIYDKVNDANKEKIVQRVGTIEKFMKLMPKLFGMIGEGSSPHPKGSKKYKAHMAAKHANMNEVEDDLSDKIYAGIKAGMSKDEIISKYADKDNDPLLIDVMYSRIKFKMNEGKSVNEAWQAFNEEPSKPLKLGGARTELPIRYHVVVNPGAVIAGIFDTREEAQKLELEMEKRNGRTANIVPLKTKKYKPFDILQSKDEDQLSDVDYYASRGRLHALQKIKDAGRSDGKYPTLGPEEWQGYAIAAGLDPNKVPDNIMLDKRD